MAARLNYHKRLSQIEIIMLYCKIYIHIKYFICLSILDILFKTIKNRKFCLTYFKIIEILIYIFVKLIKYILYFIMID